MNAHALRNWGIGVGAAALAGALAIATFTGDPQPTPAPSEAPPEIAAPLEPEAAPAVSEEPVFEAADAQGPPPPAVTQNLSFIVRFQGAGPLGRAQAAAAQGREAEAQRSAEAALRTQASLRGLCFDRFTVGGAEMVLRPCAPVAAGEQATARDRWLTRLRSMPAVAYAEVNSVAEPGRTP
ncbi:MAG: hypothetical protein AB7P07_08325 [Hyphomonadaceae bacterium]